MISCILALPDCYIAVATKPIETHITQPTPEAKVLTCRSLLQGKGTKVVVAAKAKAKEVKTLRLHASNGRSTVNAPRTIASLPMTKETGVMTPEDQEDRKVGARKAKEKGKRKEEVGTTAYQARRSEAIPRVTRAPTSRNAQWTNPKFYVGSTRMESADKGATVSTSIKALQHRFGRTVQRRRKRPALAQHALRSQQPQQPRDVPHQSLA